MADSWLYVIVLIALIALNLAQFFLFAKELQKLVDKLMSRDFSEYRRAETPKAKNTSPRNELLVFEEKPPEGLMF